MTGEDTTDWLDAPMDPKLRAHIVALREENARLKAHAPTVLGYIGVYPMHDVYLLAATTAKPTLAAAVETLGTAGIPTAVVRVDEEGRIA